MRNRKLTHARHITALLSVLLLGMAFWQPGSAPTSVLGRAHQGRPASAAAPQTAIAGAPYLVKDINTQRVSPLDVGPPELSSSVTIGNIVYFVANDGIHHRELWKSDGTTAGTALVKDIGAPPIDMVALNTTLFFITATDDDRPLLWRSDGTTAGTRALKDSFDLLTATEPPTICCTSWRRTPRMGRSCGAATAPRKALFCSRISSLAPPAPSGHAHCERSVVTRSSSPPTTA